MEVANMQVTARTFHQHQEAGGGGPAKQSEAKPANSKNQLVSKNFKFHFLINNVVNITKIIQKQQCIM
jgi:hypothetical protein